MPMPAVGPKREGMTAARQTRCARRGGPAVASAVRVAAWVAVLAVAGLTVTAARAADREARTRPPAETGSPHPRAETAVAATAATAWLVSPEEAAREQALPDEVPLTRAMPEPGAPRIELLDPESGALLRPPFEIRLRWSSPDGSALDPASLRVLYGRSRLDLTGRLLAAGTRVDPRGLNAPAQVLPAGLHRLQVEISDSRQRTGRREFVLEVADGAADGGAPLGQRGAGPATR
jgi:hypothetical protein